MATAKDVITKAYQIANIVSSEFGEELTAAQLSEGLSRFNDMLHGWDLEGINIAHVTLAASDAIPYPDSHLEALKLNLATRLAADNGRDLAVKTLIDAEKGKKAVESFYDEPQSLSVDAALSPHYNRSRHF